MRFHEIHYQSCSLDEALANDPARLSRAKQLGFDTTRVWYHGSTGKDIKAFDISKLGTNTGAKSASKGFFFASDPKVASSYGKHESYMLDASRPYYDKYSAQVIEMEAEMKVLINQDEQDAEMESLNYSFYDAPKKKRISYADYSTAQNVISAKYNTEDHRIAMARYMELNKTVNDLRNRMKNLTTMGSISKAVVFPVYLKIQRPLVHDMGGSHYRETSYNDILISAKRGRRDGAIIQNTYDPGYRGADAPMCDIAIVFSPSQVRSIYANFALDDAESGNISA